MGNYVTNILLWVRGWRRFSEVAFKPGWSATSKRWYLVYGLDYGVNVLTGGAVEPISTRAQRHRSGKVWDSMLDLIERFDSAHGKESGPALWGSVESPVAIQWASAVLWLGALLWAVI